MDESPGTTVAMAGKKTMIEEIDLQLGPKVSAMSLSDLVKAKASTSALASLSDLPPDLWANIMGYARYEDCLRVFSVNKTFLNEVIPRVKEVFVFDKRALRVGPARRFTSVEIVVIACLFADPADAPALPERPANIGYDVSTWDEIHAMTGELSRDANGFPVRYARPLEVDLAVVTAAVPFLSAFSSLKQVIGSISCP